MESEKLKTILYLFYSESKAEMNGRRSMPPSSYMDYHKAASWSLKWWIFVIRLKIWIMQLVF
ncbi:hypothetical protein AtNW77_Chr2g0238491 [Arabidopsis thaliana]